VVLDAVAKKIGSVPCCHRFFLCAVGPKIRSHAPEGNLCSPELSFLVEEDAGFPGKGLRVGILARQRMALVLDLADLRQGGFLLRESFVIPEAAAGFRLPVQFPSCSYQFFSAVKAPAEIINLRPSFLARQLPAGIPFQNFQTANPERLEFYIHVSILLQEDSMKNGGHKKRPGISPGLLISWCPEQDSNLHGCPRDPKSRAYTNSAIRAHQLSIQHLGLGVQRGSCLPAFSCVIERNR
jgi:hypothetical protein